MMKASRNIMKKWCNMAILIAVVVAFFVCGTASATDIYVGPGETYTTIQSAVTAVTAGDTIIVRDGTYTGKVDLGKQLTIRSENGSANCIVTADLTSGYVFEVTGDYVNISGFNVTGATKSGNAGIYLSGRQHCNISNNNVSNNEYGIYLSSSSNNTIYNNYFNNTNNAYDDSYNTWNITPTTGTNIIGGPWIGGNYWSDYTGTDSDGYGLGDSQYPITCGRSVDRYPLMSPDDNTATETISIGSKLTATKEFSGEVVQLTGVQTNNIIWNASNFGGFCYNLNDEECIGTETLTILAGTLEGPDTDRIIEDEIVDYSLEYATTPIWHEYELYKNLGLTVERNYYESDSGYWTAFWMGERYIAINDNASKLARLLVEFNSTDTKTLRVGELWDLGGGFTLSAVEIDGDGDEVWFTLSKNGEEIGSTVVGTGDSDLQTRVCTLSEDVAGESDIPIFSCYVCGVFAGTDSNIVQVKYVFLMDNDILQITTGEYYDNMEVVFATSSSVTLGNRKDLYLNQSPSTCQIMGNLSFKTIYNASAIEFYPYLIKDELSVLSGGGGFISNCCGNNSWDLFENYTIGLIQVDLIGKKAWFVLCKDGVVVDERILTEEYKAPVDSDCRYSYVKNGIEIINATLKEAFHGCNTDMVELGEVYQRSEVDGSILINNEFHVFLPATEPSGISWNLSDDYMFTVSDIGCYNEEVWLQLSKNGMILKENILNEDNVSTFTYTSGIGGINCVLDSIFRGRDANVVKIVNVNQYSDVNGTALIADGAHFFKSADPDGMPLELTDGYVLTIKDIGYHNRYWHHVDDKVWLELSKNGSVLEEDILKSNDLFAYTNDLESFSCVIEAVFNGCLADVVKLKNINQYSSAGVQLIDNESKIYASEDPIGDIWELWEGYSFAPKDISLCGRKVWLSLLKDGVLVKDAIISEDEWFKYYNSTGAMVFGTYVETVFAGMSIHLVKVGYTTQYSEIDGRLFIELDPESWQLQEGYYLTAQEIYRNNSVWLQLSKNNKLVDEGLFNDSFNLQNGTAGHTVVSGTINGHDNWNVQLFSITQYHEANGTVLTTWPSMNLDKSQSYDNTKLIETPTSIHKTITVNDSGSADYTSIQAAIIASNPKDTIIVYNGTYHENIIIDKQLALIGIDMPVVDGGREDSTIEVTADDCTIDGFRVVRGNPYGIYLYGSASSALQNNEMVGNNYGIYLYSSSNNNLTGNTANSNTDYGIYLSSSNSNLIYNNHFNNTQNAYDNGKNRWNITKTKGTNIIGGTWLGGNHWSDYTGVDEDGDRDRLGDTLTPYNIGITNGGDYHPLVALPLTPGEDTNGNGVISSGGGSSSGGVGASGEARENILITEREREYVYKGVEVCYSYDLEGNMVQYINFKGLTNAGRIGARVEILSNTSTLVDTTPPNKVYKNLNIFIGNSGWGTSSNIANATISFTVEKSWITNEKIDKSSIKMYRYSSGKWNELSTSYVTEDADCLYFKSETPGFSPFVIAGEQVSAGENDTDGDSGVTSPADGGKDTTDQTSFDEKTGLPGFCILTSLLVILMAVWMLREK
jgi:S-layer protein (TIGR01567 family)